jgi:hypothetical protein
LSFKIVGLASPLDGALRVGMLECWSVAPHFAFPLFPFAVTKVLGVGSVTRFLIIYERMKVLVTVCKRVIVSYL